MTNRDPSDPWTAEHLIGMSVNLPAVGQASLVCLLHQNTETSIYMTSHPGIALKTFNLACGKMDEVSYGPFLSYRSEVENFEDIQKIADLRSRVPAYYGSNIDLDHKFAYIAMEYLQGDNLLAWCQSAAAAGYPAEWLREFRRALYDTLTIVKKFHDNDIILIDFKPDNVIRLVNGGVKFVDLGAFFTPRHGRNTENYVYLATPDYAELVIDTSNIQTGLPLNEGSDIFSAGVALFEMATGSSRLAIAAETAQKILACPAIYRFRDSQIKDIWRLYPHLTDLLPLAETQLHEGRLLFSEFWHLLKGYLAGEIPDWESMNEAQHRQMLLDVGTAFITEQLPEELAWLAEPIARCTTLRSFRLPSVGELMDLIAAPAPEPVRNDIAQHCMAIDLARNLSPPLTFRDPLNIWEVRLNAEIGRWAISAPTVAEELSSVAAFTFLKAITCDQDGHRFYEIVGDLEADDIDNEKLTLARLAGNYTAWVN